jgi:hypothetical protein
MSAGAFQQAVYISDSTEAFAIRVQPETIAAWNQQGTGTISPFFPSVRASGGRRKIGINARIARFRFTGTPPAGYKAGSVFALPILTPGAYLSLVKLTAYPYLGGTIELVGKTPEVIR